MREKWALAAAFYACLGTSAIAQTATTERTAKGPAGKDIRIGVYVSVTPDCKSGTLPTIRLSAPPRHGNVTVKQAKVRATNYKQCLAVEVPAFVAFYRSRSGFTGTDLVSLEVQFPNGRTEIQRISITIAAPPSQQSI